MDKLSTNFDGGFPLWLDDYRWFQGANEAGFESLVKAILNGDDACRLHGCIVTDQGANYAISAGAILFKGEIIKVDAHTAAKPTSSQPDSIYVWMVTETNDPTGQKTFKDGSVVQTYVKRRATYINVNNIPGGTSTDDLAVITTDFYGMVSRHLSLKIPTRWTKASLLTGFSHHSDRYLQFKKNHLNQVELRGAIWVANKDSTHIFTLPTDMRPRINTVLLAWNGPTARLVNVYKTGIVALASGNMNNVNLSIEFNQVFSLDSDHVTPSGTGGGGGTPTT